ncbi:flagellar hook-associated protein FlgK [Hydrogenovibrio sp. JE_KL2]|uniref:flagellar hook-associated protein FlgK n=1 Tax=Hydrogenovibrio sp. JE_KL2 TaxID=2651188 RepID=UPI00128D4FA2|nr:flagellar hook-associated protein FlgK [Hydrogenovibrio sp. JE_KL2]MPQ76960.1 flagellar hook-associated protein FlgK [Hydrogenovibrio sp. JE_KL2]
MANLLTIGISAASTFQKAIEVTGNNTANVSTPGYNRQRAEIISNSAGLVGNAYTGGGSTVESVQRIYASYIQTQLVSANSLKSRYDEQLSLAQQVEGVVASNDGSIQNFMQNLFDSFQNLANNPTDTSSRQQVIDQSNNLQTMVGNLSGVLKDTQKQVNDQISGLTTEINNRLDTIYQINKQVSVAQSSGAQSPNELLDQRDQAILELSKYMDIKTYTQSDGEMVVYTGNGKYPLVTSNTVNHLQASSSEFTDEGRTEVYMDVSGQKTMVSSQIKSGQLGAVLDFRSNMLDKTVNDLGVMLNGLVAGVNWQHYQGYDENGDAGGNVYTPLNLTADKSVKNVGTEDGSNIVVSFKPAIAGNQPPYTPATQPATYTAKQTDLATANAAIGNLQPKDYIVKVNSGGNFEVYDRNNPTTVLGTVAFGSSGQVDGWNFDFSSVAAGTVQAGDKFLIQPNQGMLDNFKTEISDPNKLATRGQSPDPADVAPTAAAIGDNTNIANLASLSDKKLLFNDASGNPAQTLLGGYSLMSTHVGAYVQATQTQSVAQTNVYKQISDRRESMSGVSLDEEAANLIKFQQAYQASAQIIQASRTLFDTLIGAIR